MRARPFVVALALLLAAMPARAGVNRWTPRGPYGGPVLALAMDPFAQDVIYAGTFFAGAFKTADGGAHWQFSNQGLPLGGGYFNVMALAIDPLEPSTIYAGLDFAGVSKSTDGGHTWKGHSDGLVDYGTIVNGIAIDPTAPSTVYVATLDGVFKSTDAGCTWVEKNVGLPEVGDPPLFYTNGITIDPTNPSVLYLGTLFDRAYKSVDGAESWFFTGTGLPYPEAGAPALDPVNPSHLLMTNTYFIPDLGGGDGAILASDDAGASWHPAGTSLPDTFYRSIAFDPATPGRVYASSDLGVFRSDDGGATWNPASTGLLNLKVRPLLVGPGPRLLAGTDLQGVFRSDDAGASWAPARSGLAAAAWGILSVGVSNPNVLFATGSGDVQGIVRSVDGGQTWSGVGAGLNPNAGVAAVAIDPNDADVVFASQATEAPNAFKTVDGGDSWAPIENGLNGDIPGAFAVDRSNSLNVYVGGGANFYRSSDGGSSWTPSTTTLPNSFSILARGNGLPLLALSAGVPNRSEDGGDTWSPSAAGLEGVNVSYMTAAPSDPSRLYAGTILQGIYGSSDGGNSWALLPGDLSAYAIGGIAVDPDDADHLFATTQTQTGTPYAGQGVFESLDGGTSWSPLNRGLSGSGLEGLGLLFPAGGKTLYVSSLEGFLAYTFSPAPAPVPGAVAPYDGPSAGGTAVTISGQGFQSGATVKIAGVPATSVVVVDGVTITAVTPAGAAGASEVSVENPDGQIETLARGFVYDFGDVPAFSDFHDAVTALTQAGVTVGCGGGLFCPSDPLTRGQMAVFIEKTIHGADTPPSKKPGSFDDVLPCSPEGPYILELAFEGITAGCGMDVFCPDAPNTRAQGAVFILKAEHGAVYVPPAATGTVFTDVPATAFAADYIEQLAAEGLTVGCGGGAFCPDAPLTRGQAAAYISASILAP